MEEEIIEWMKGKRILAQISCFGVTFKSELLIHLIMTLMISLLLDSPRNY